MDDLADRIAETAALLLEAAQRCGHTITADGRISEAAAGELLGYAPGTLRNLRDSLIGPKGYRRAAGPGSRYSYRIFDLAEWIESARDDERLHVSP